MMREIKFRAWNPYDRVMFYLTKDSEITAYNYELDIWGDGWEVVEITAQGKRIVVASVTKTGESGGTLLQFTGLTDKNGTEIYEGDIIKTPLGNGHIEWEAPLYWLEPDWTWTPFEMRENGFTFSNTIITLGMVEVVGNIYENKDLLEKVNS